MDYFTLKQTAAALGVTYRKLYWHLREGNCATDRKGEDEMALAYAAVGVGVYQDISHQDISRHAPASSAVPDAA